MNPHSYSQLIKKFIYLYLPIRLSVHTSIYLFNVFMSVWVYVHVYCTIHVQRLEEGILYSPFTLPISLHPVSLWAWDFHFSGLG